MGQECVKSLGFKCGVEIHQQLLTSKKLFCRCPAAMYSKHHDAEIVRHMRPTLSEMGVYDGCALMEFKTKKEIVYLLNKESVCTYEMDDTPPFPINQDALDVAIEIALLLNCQIVDEMHIARKQYLDGSIPTGFQRTAIVGINGYVDVPGKRIRVRQLSIEEDACREVSDEGHTITYRTDRLGIPLIEVVTEPDFETPEEAALGVKTIGRLLRATGKVRRGIGAVRQDVNVSIDGGCRVEIKGVPRYQFIAALTKTEALRQRALLDLRDEMNRRGITKEAIITVGQPSRLSQIAAGETPALRELGDACPTVSAEQKDLTNELRNTRSEILKSAIEKGFRIRGIRISGIEGLLNWKTQPGRTFAHELTGRVRVIACLDQIPNLFHTDHYPDYVGAHIDLRRIRNVFQLRDKDAVVVTWGPEKDTITACNEIRDRVLEAFDGVPLETRQRLRDGLTDFERILPGADRMYPDTDHPPLRITPARVQEIKIGLPEKTRDVEERFKSYGLPEDTIEYLALSRHVNLIESLAEEDADMKLVGRIIGQTKRSLERQGHNLNSIGDEIWKQLIAGCDERKIQAKHFEDAVLRLSKDPKLSVEGLLDQFTATFSPQECASQKDLPQPPFEVVVVLKKNTAV